MPSSGALAQPILLSPSGSKRTTTAQMARRDCRARSACPALCRAPFGQQRAGAEADRRRRRDAPQGGVVVAEAGVAGHHLHGRHGVGVPPPQHLAQRPLLWARWVEGAQARVAGWGSGRAGRCP